MYNWRELEKKCPLTISKLREHIGVIESAVDVEVNQDNLQDLKPRLIEASAELEILINKMLTLLYNREALQTETDKALLTLLEDNASGYLALIDERQNQLMEVFDGSNSDKVGVGRTSAFKKIIKVAIYGVIWNSLDYATTEWNKIKEEDLIKKDMRTFLRIFFYILSINLSVSGGFSRRKAFGLASSQNRPILPSAWKSMFSKPTEDKIRSDYKDKYGEELPSEDFTEITSEENYGNF